jgi:hypothetical protein
MLVEVEQERAKTRKKLGKPVTHGDAGKTRDVVASKIGDISGISAARAGAVVSAIDKLGGDENTKAERDELRELLNNNISGAHAKAIADGHIETHAKKGAIKKAASRKTDAVKYEPLPKEADQDEADTPHAADENTIMFLKYEEICDYLRDLEPGVLTKLEKDHWIDANNEIASLLEGL